MDQDIIIIGGGPAGMTAALYALRAGRRVLLLEADTCGGQITHTAQVDNYPGLPGVSGLELADRMLEQILDLGAVVEPDRASALSRIAGGWRVTGEFGAYEAPAVIYAAGTTHRQLDVPGEAQRVGRGVSFCAVCDGAFYKDRSVAVVGGGNAALSDTRYLSGLCKQVTLIHRRDSFRAEQAAVEAVRGLNNVTFLTPAQVTRIDGDEPVVLTLNTPDGTRTLEVDGLFEAVGQLPDTQLLRGLADLDETGYVLAGEDCKASAEGLFAAGDCRAKSVRQLTTAVSDGAAAALSACKYLQTL